MLAKKFISKVRVPTRELWPNKNWKARFEARLIESG